jgi:transcriptional regulator with XRE-family HTH domain
VKRIDAIAKRQRLSANKLADLSGIGRGYLSEVRSGRKSPTLRTLIKVARALGVPLRDLFA